MGNFMEAVGSALGGGLVTLVGVFLTYRFAAPRKTAREQWAVRRSAFFEQLMQQVHFAGEHIDHASSRGQTANPTRPVSEVYREFGAVMALAPLYIPGSMIETLQKLQLALMQVYEGEPIQLVLERWRWDDVKAVEQELAKLAAVKGSFW